VRSEGEGAISLSYLNVEAVVQKQISRFQICDSRMMTSWMRCFVLYYIIFC
jgi:hypothetical protein